MLYRGAEAAPPSPPRQICFGGYSYVQLFQPPLLLLLRVLLRLFLRERGAVTLPSFPDRPVWDSDSSGDSYPVYVAMPAFMTRGSANLQAAVELDSGSSCPCRG